MIDLLFFFTLAKKSYIILLIGLEIRLTEGYLDCRRILKIFWGRHSPLGLAMHWRHLDHWLRQLISKSSIVGHPRISKSLICSWPGQAGGWGPTYCNRPNKWGRGTIGIHANWPIYFHVLDLVLSPDSQDFVFMFLPLVLVIRSAEPMIQSTFFSTNNSTTTCSNTPQSL